MKQNNRVYALTLGHETLRIQDDNCQPLDRQETLDRPLWIITDYQDAGFGVMVLSSRISDLAPLIEKRLRDEGHIDTYSRVIIHQRQRVRDAYRVFYTVVALDVWSQWQQWLKDSRHYIVPIPLGAALLGWAQSTQRRNHLILLVQPRDVALLALVEGQVMVAERMPLVVDSTAELLAKRVQRQLQESGFATVHPKPTEGTIISHGVLPPDYPQQLSQALGQVLAGILWSVLPAEHRADHDPQFRSAVPALFATAHEAMADVPPELRAQLLLSSVLPWCAAAMLVVALAMGWQGQRWWQQAEQLEQQATALLQSVPTEDMHQALNQALDDSNALIRVADEVQAFYALNSQRQKLPSLPRLIQDIQASQPQGLDVIELGVVVEGEAALIILTGRSDAFVPTMEREGHLVRELAARGYQVVRQEIFSSPAGINTFELALNWMALDVELPQLSER